MRARPIQLAEAARLARLAGLALFWLPCAARGAETAAAVEVVIGNYTFQPAHITVRAGETVRWTNHEKRTSHSIVFPAEGGLESERLFPGESWQRAFPQAGTYPYTCGPHPEMKGSVVVAE